MTGNGKVHFPDRKQAADPCLKGRWERKRETDFSRRKREVGQYALPYKRV